MNINFDNDIPIYLQVMEYIKNYIISGKIKNGEKLPSVREFSIKFKVNPNTVQKALYQLENIGLIYTDRTNGKFVTIDSNIVNKIKNDKITEFIDEYFNNMENIGIKQKDAINYINERAEK
ncbi:MAG: GntR family transcriptional regulator [bacterium]|nr:GntR family transcriptional regulator [bacterium]